MLRILIISLFLIGTVLIFSYLTTYLVQKFGRLIAKLCEKYQTWLAKGGREATPFGDETIFGTFCIILQFMRNGHQRLDSAAPIAIEVNRHVDHDALKRTVYTV